MEWAPVVFNKIKYIESQGFLLAKSQEAPAANRFIYISILNFDII